MYRHHHHHRGHPLLMLGAFWFLSRLLRGRHGGWYGRPSRRGPYFL